MLISGGTYLEYCVDPYWHELYGSGLRAAVALSKVCDVELRTYGSVADNRTLTAISKSFGIECVIAERPESISFNYQHPLATPSVTPHISSIPRQSSMKVEGSSVLRFGMLEGDAVVNAEFAVYDPQSPVNPEHFGRNGSRADHLAIVANYSEAVQLAKSEDLSIIGQQLLKEQGVEVVIVKRGPLGCTVISPRSIETVPAFHTSRVWPIGSGDIFAAAFAHHWGERHLSPLEAARLASMSAALYCEVRALPLPEEIEKRFTATPIESDESRFGTALVYLAAPFFNMAERWLVGQARSALIDQRLQVFSPLHDVGVGIASEVVPADIKALEKCTVVLALLSHLDPGTVFEVGWARKRQIPVIALVENERPESLKMFEGTSCEILDDFATAIYRTVWAATGK
jgi:nucleoside 2-deoxyribosyltransferase